MKQLLTATIICKFKNIVRARSPYPAYRNAVQLFTFLILFSTFAFTGCQKQENASTNEVQSPGINKPDSNPEFRANTDNLGDKTLWELQQARSATAKYLNINNAFADNYVDINIVVPNMGYHFLKSQHVADGIFDIRKPEILVYNKNEDGGFVLVAVEYAVPLASLPDGPPEGFTGNTDVWERNTDFGLWLLHAWIWKNNPDGVFNPTNPLVILH